MPKLFVTDTASAADIRVFFTDIRSEAHLAVFETDDQWAATEPGIWFYTDIRGEADKSVHFTDSQWDADLIAFRTDVQPDAGWLDPGKAGLL